jgi:four helix bundle protein
LGLARGAMVVRRIIGQCWSMFPDEKWKVYRLALELREIAAELSTVRVRGCASDLDHLRRAASSVLLNIAEGSLYPLKGKKLDFYRTARASTGEYNAALMVLEGPHPKRRLIEHARDTSDHTAALITNLIASVERHYK